VLKTPVASAFAASGVSVDAAAKILEIRAFAGLDVVHLTKWFPAFGEAVTDAGSFWAALNALCGLTWPAPEVASVTELTRAVVAEQKL
jgi:hypothetical protein